VRLGVLPRLSRPRPRGGGLYRCEEVVGHPQSRRLSQVCVLSYQLSSPLIHRQRFAHPNDVVILWLPFAVLRQSVGGWRERDGSLMQEKIGFAETRRTSGRWRWWAGGRQFHSV
jgi:hypothetical protein